MAYEATSIDFIGKKITAYFKNPEEVRKVIATGMCNEGIIFLNEDKDFEMIPYERVIKIVLDKKNVGINSREI